jgi:MinD-like ATPase involved in chromosome partitioning or flagellar assembly
MPSNRAPAGPDALANARRILAGPFPEPLRRVISRSIAVGSGKGGVGKTITACNLAIYYARKDLRVGLVDLDPLSDVASLLDLYESEQAVRPGGTPVPAGGSTLDGQVMPAFRGLDILFPYQKLAAGESRNLMQKIYGQHLAEIDGRYDVLIFDMPAGLGLEDNLAWLPFMKRLVLVTNPEPTAHASAGAYAKEVQRLFPGTVIQVWHNRFSREIREGFHPSDVAGNYNRFVEAEDRLTPEESLLLRDFAFVPEDPALDLLKGEPHPEVHVLNAMKDAVDYAHGRLLAQATRTIGLPPRIQRLVTSHVQRNPRIGATAAYLVRMEEHFAASLLPRNRQPRPGAGERLFSERQVSALTEYLDRVKRSGLRRELIRIGDMLDEQIRILVESRGPFASRLAPLHDGSVDRELGTLLVILNRAARGSLLMRNQGVLLLFYFSLHKLFQSRTLVALLRNLIPRRHNQKGRPVRDRFRQIRALVERDPDYRERYLKAVKTFHALVTRQVGAVARALDLWDLVLLDSGSRIDGRPYVKLLGAFLHETLYSGLSVIVGFDYRSAAAAFQDGAERLLISVRESA